MTRLASVAASAPGKVTLFGEHAVVYGQPAIVGAINRRVTVSIQETGDATFRLRMPDVGEGEAILRLRNGEVKLQSSEPRLRMAALLVSAAMSQVLQEPEKLRGASLRVTSEMPVGAGLGTSAALVVATIAGFSSLLDEKLDTKTMVELARRAELSVQGSSSGMDVCASVVGGMNLFRRTRSSIQFKKLQPREALPVAVGFTPRILDTAQTVRKVAEFRKRKRALVDAIFECIGLVSNRAVQALRDSDLESLGELMNASHGLLSALGISTRELDEMVNAARGAGALGAKLTGAGMGGCVMSLAQSFDKARKIDRALELAGGHPLKLSFSPVGVRVEEATSERM